MRRKAFSPIVAILIALAALIIGAVVYTYVTGPEASGPGPGPKPGPSPIVDACGGCPRGYECTPECGPPVVSDTDPPPKWSCWPSGKPRICPICLASSVRISTPKGLLDVKDIRVGAEIWSLDAQGARIASRVASVTAVPAPEGHQVVHLVLTDGRETRVSPGHPTADGRRVGDLRAGDQYDGARVSSAELVPYGGAATYDVLPDGPTGLYWADDILLGSTLNAARR